MSDSFDAHPKKLADLLGQYEKKPIVVPPFQRGYSWTTGQVSTFWEDILTFFQGLKTPNDQYFLGPIVLKVESERITLLDGQQRLGTAVILMSLMRDVAKAANSDNGKALARDIQHYFLERKQGYSLYLNETDAEYFRDTIQKDPAVNTRHRMRSHKLILNAKNQLNSGLQSLLQGKSSEETVECLAKLKEIIESYLTMVAIYVATEEDAYHIFETLNDRGLRLSNPDLLLNFLMGNAATDLERKEIRNKWNGMLSRIGKRDVDEFLRHMWLSNYGDVKANGLFREIKSHIKDRKVTSVEFIGTCERECDFYISILDVEEPTVSKGASPFVKALVKNLGVRTCFPVLLAGIEILKADAFEKLSRLLVGLIVRHSLFTNLNPGDLENEFYSLSRVMRSMKARNETDAKCMFYVRDSLRKLNPSDEQVKNGARELVLSKSEANYILPTIANYLQSINHEIGIDKANLEHIFPQNPDEVEWPNMDELDEYTWHLGNLTILGNKLNEKAANLAFSKKKTLHYTQSTIEMTKMIVQNYSDWNVENILERAANLGDYAAKIWPGPKSDGP